jgi:hypothetical protein
MFGGELEAKRASDGGFVVRARLPLTVPALSNPVPSKAVPA